MTKAIAFYLPQYHRIPENDIWWGEGFTEWTNVRKAQPLFEGHVQPHQPLADRYYDLKNPEDQRWQINLAKSYGIGGFCFYYFWFNGKTLLESPLQNWLQDSSLDFPFCLCWSNENWTRRWDGLEDDILIKQEYSPKDDRDFIQHIIPYLKDPRYIRICGKPLVILYRPSLLPNPRFTASQWRWECLRAGVGEIFLAYTQSFDHDPPAIFGFDAAIQFPPVGISTASITSEFLPLHEGSQYSVHDYRELARLAKNQYQVKREYLLFAGLCPTWDNTARRGMSGACILHNSSPSVYSSWLSDACSYARNQANGIQDLDLVFINAWNEWGEGCHLEPDKCNGLTYLQATQDALVGIESEDAATVFAANASQDAETFAIVIHAFYIDVFESILATLSERLNPHQSVKLYITCPKHNAEAIEHLLSTTNIGHQIYTYKNHGRDVLPFLRILPEVLQAGHPYLIKIHTKKTLHRKDGDEWLESLTKDLIGGESLERLEKQFRSDDKLGILGPTGNVLPVRKYLGSNLSHIKSLLSQIDVAYKLYLDTVFVAGTMFAARSTALKPLLALEIHSDEFEAEAGQTDGTLAHAVERIISVAALNAGFHTSAIDGVTTHEFRFALPTDLLEAGKAEKQHLPSTPQELLNFDANGTPVHCLNNKRKGFQGNIDYPPRGIPLRGMLEIRGWCFIDGEEIKQLNVWIGNILIGKVEYGISRADVLSTYPKASTDAVGFYMMINFLNHPELQVGLESSLYLEVVATEGSFIGLYRRVNLPSPRTKYFSHLLTRSTDYSFEDQSEQSISPQDLGVRTICFYLPQFHAIPENDHWWGRGFTEWVNVAQGIPLFPGHEQPRIPADLGFYDLNDPEVQLRQIAIAQHYGIEGFCYYIYWFGGKRLLETPTERLLSDRRFEAPFCLCWANENWSRRWDGGDSDILMAQHYSPEDDYSLITEMSRYFQLSNYIRFNGKPVFVVYNTTLLPTPQETTNRWRNRCIQLGIGEIHLVMCHSFTGQNPHELGFDAAVEFPPLRFQCDQIENDVGLCDPLFQGKVYDWMRLVRNHIYKSPPKEFRLSPSLVLGWDNVARKGVRGHIFHGANPKTFGEWSHAISRRRLLNLPPEERFLFINAWNEWAEGTYLEPDRRHGYAYLNALAQGLKSAVRYGPLRG